MKKKSLQYYTTAYQLNKNCSYGKKNADDSFLRYLQYDN